jgi:FdhD protein
MPAPVAKVPALRVAQEQSAETARVIPVETPVALTYDGATHAVMMATPADLDDFAIGFSLTEGIIQRTADLKSLEIEEHPDGMELRMWLDAGLGAARAKRRRTIAGPTGCGLCGVESLEAASAAPPKVASGGTFSGADIREALASLEPAQTLNLETRAVHGAGYWTKARGLVALREDVGRHNALDKLVGAVHRLGVDPAAGIVVLTSRVSVEMVQKTAVMGAPIIVAVSAPTSLAITTAEAANITLIAVARRDAFEIFTGRERIAAPATPRRTEATTGHDLHASRC